MTNLKDYIATYFPIVLDRPSVKNLITDSEAYVPEFSFHEDQSGGIEIYFGDKKVCYVTAKKVSPDYIEFLERMIKLEEAGSEGQRRFSELLQHYSPIVFKQVVRFEVFKGSQVVNVVLDADTGQFIFEHSC